MTRLIHSESTGDASLRPESAACSWPPWLLFLREVSRQMEWKQVSGSSVGSGASPSSGWMAFGHSVLMNSLLLRLNIPGPSKLLRHQKGQACLSSACPGHRRGQLQPGAQPSHDRGAGQRELTRSDGIRGWGGHGPKSPAGLKWRPLKACFPLTRRTVIVQLVSRA